MKLGFVLVVGFGYGLMECAGLFSLVMVQVIHDLDPCSRDIHVPCTSLPVMDDRQTCDQVMDDLVDRT